MSRVINVRTIDFDDAFAVAATDTRGEERPLIWFNCCKAGGAVGQELFSISVDLAERGCAVIAPRTEISEGFATAFAQDFYRYLGRNASPRKALLAARLESITKRNNPLGIVFTGLGNPM